MNTSKTYSKPMMAIERFRADAFVASCIEEISVNLLPPEKGASYYKCDGWNHNNNTHGTADGTYDDIYEQLSFVNEGNNAKSQLESFIASGNYHIDQVYGTSDINSLHKSYSNSTYFQPFVAAHKSGSSMFTIIAEGTVTGSKIEDYFTQITTKNAS